jgi:hypothetical protein
MKYLEELSPGDCFEFQNNNYVVLLDYKKSGQRCCAMLSNGSTRWLNPDAIVDISPIYTIDKDNNIIPIKPTEAIKC